MRKIESVTYIDCNKDNNCYKGATIACIHCGRIQKTK